jgi:nucleotide-binding universal stress UspA family protein
MAEKPTIHRILVALDTSPECASALAMAADLAAGQNAELLALFIEDVNLFNLADLPFAREIDRVFAMEREFDTLRMARSLRAQAEQLRRTLETITSERKVPSSLRVVRGHYVAEALSAATSMDILLFGRMKSAPRTAARALLAAWKEAGGRRTVGVVYDGGEAADRTLALSLELARVLESKLLVIIPAANSAEAEQLQKLAKPVLEDAGLPARFSHVPLDNPAKLVNAARHEECSLVVVPRDCGCSSDAMIQALLEGLECPMVLAA